MRHLYQWLVGFAVLAIAACSSEVGPRIGGHEAELTAPEPEAKQIQLSTGIDMHYVELGNPDGPPVILLHGYTDSHHSYDLVYSALPLGFHYFGLDQRGHGLSSKPSCCYTQANFSDDVLAFMDALSIDEAVVVGHSMGSLIAHKFAAEHPSRVSGLVLIGSAPDGDNDVTQFLKTLVDELTDPVPREFIEEFQASTVLEPLPEDFFETVVDESSRVPATVWKQALDGLIVEDHVAQLGNITAPTQLFYGEFDPIFSLEEQLALLAAIPNSELVLFEDIAHAPHWESPQEFKAKLTQFLGQVVGN